MLTVVIRSTPFLLSEQRALCLLLTRSPAHRLILLPCRSFFSPLPSSTRPFSAEPSSSSLCVFETNAELKRLVDSGRLTDARLLFDGIPRRDEVSWTTIITGYVRHSDPHEVIALFSSLMRSPSDPADPFVLSLVIKACTLPSDGFLLPLVGASLHAFALKSGALAASVFVGTALLDMYSKTGQAAPALRVFDEMPLRNVVSWTSAIAAFVRADRPRDAVRLFMAMRTDGVPYDSHTFAIALKACADAGLLSRGREIHAYGAKLGMVASPFVANTLATMYTKCGRLEDGVALLDGKHSRDVVVWTTVIAAYAQTGREEDAVKAFLKMRKEGVSPNGYTYAALISACVGIKHLGWGMQLHAHVIRQGFAAAISVSNALVTLYAGVGLLVPAMTLFREMEIKDIVSWSAIISGYSQEGQVEDAFALFNEMMQTGWPAPNEFTFSILLSLCAFAAILDSGRQLHAHALTVGLDHEVVVISALITMYSKCGSLEEAAKVFDCRKINEVVSWTAMINGYAEHGKSKEAIELFDAMQRTLGLRPDSVAFIGALTACCHVGNVELGLLYFEAMRKKYRLQPAKEHYGCIVDLLGRAGRVTEAEKVIGEMPPDEVDGVVWTALMRACATRGHEEGCRRAAAKVQEFEPWGAGQHVVMANLYAGKGSWQEVAKERKMMREKGLKKEVGLSWIGVGKECLGTFVAGDRSHERMEEIYLMLELVNFAARLSGYVPELDFGLEEEE